MRETNWTSPVPENETWTTRWMFVTVDTLLFAAILSGNLLTIYVLRTNLRHSRVISNNYVLSLAISDTLVGMTLLYHIAFNIFPELSRSKRTCIFRFVLVLQACCSSILNVMAISIDRYLAILHPFKYETLMTKRVVRSILGVVYGHSFCLSIVPAYWNTWADAEVCELGQVLPRYYLIAVLLPLFLIIWTLMLAIYGRIWREAVGQIKKLRRTNANLQSSRSSFQVVLLVMGCFSVCWLPFLGVACAQAAGYRDSISSITYKAVLCLALSSSAVNPIIYAWKNTELKENFKKVILCRYQNQGENPTSNPLMYCLQV